MGMRAGGHDTPSRSVNFRHRRLRSTCEPHVASGLIVAGVKLACTGVRHSSGATAPEPVHRSAARRGRAWAARRPAASTGFGSRHTPGPTASSRGNCGAGGVHGSAARADQAQLIAVSGATSSMGSDRNPERGRAGRRVLRKGDVQRAARCWRSNSCSRARRAARSACAQLSMTGSAH